MNPTDRHDDAVTCLAGRQAAELIEREMSGKVFIVAMNGKEQLDEGRDNDEHYPGALAEFGYRKNHHDNPGTHSTKAIDQHFGAPAAFVTEDGSCFNDFFSLFQMTNLPPAPCHANLR